MLSRKEKNENKTDLINSFGKTQLSEYVNVHFGLSLFSSPRKEKQDREMIKKIKSNFVKTICTGILDRRPPSV
jgi:hypothetical protein